MICAAWCIFLKLNENMSDDVMREQYAMKRDLKGFHEDTGRRIKKSFTVSSPAEGSFKILLCCLKFRSH